MELLEIDGSYGEGGGQILRTAVALSIILGRPVRVIKVRAGRNNPGLRPQHASVLKILREVCGGRLEGGEVGSTAITFYPGVVEASSMKVDMGTAASITLVLQAVVPAASLSGSSLDLELLGGTDVPWSPTFDYFANVVLPALKLIGVRCRAEASKRGYYPNGGGAVKASVEPCEEVAPLRLAERGSNPTASVVVVSRCGRLPAQVAERQSHAAKSYLRGQGIDVESATASQVLSDSPGSSVLISTTRADCLLGSDSIGALGKSAESVGREAAKEFAAAYQSGACVDVHLSDTIAPFLSLAGTDSRILLPRVSEHLKTSLHVASLFTGCSYDFASQDRAWLASIRPAKHKL